MIKIDEYWDRYVHFHTQPTETRTSHEKTAIQRQIDIGPKALWLD
jgi:hypothetical protein